MINLDPKLLDQDKIRKERRKSLLKRCSLPILILIIIAFFFLSTWVYNLVYLISYSNKNYLIADKYTETRFVANILEPYIADYNQGNARLLMGEYERAEKSYTESLQKSPTEERLCQIYTNLSLSIEFQGDAALQGSDYSKALTLYSSAENVLYNNGCAEKGAGSGGKDSRAEAAKERLRNKRSDTTDRMNNTKDADDDEEEGPSKKQVDSGDLDKIKEGLIGPNDLRNIQNNTGGSNSQTCNVYNGSKCW